MPQRLFVLFGLLAVLVVSLSWLKTGRATAAQPPLEPAQPTSPDNSLMFIENVGQFAADARFQVRGSDHTLWLAEDAIWVTILEPAGPTASREHEADPLTTATTAGTPRRGMNLRLSFIGANPAPLMQVSEPVSTTIYYFYGNDPEKWRPDVPVWGNVRYADLYPGLDLELVGQGSTLAPRLVCHTADCAAALAAVQLEVAGAETVALDGDNLRISTAVGEWHLPLLAAVDEAGRPVEMTMQEAAVAGKRVLRPFVAPSAGYSLFLAAQTPNSPAGSSLLYSTFLGSSNQDNGLDITIDGAGNAFVIGTTYSPNFPATPGAFDDTYNGGSTDVFVSKLNTAGNELLYSTFLGGSNADGGGSIVVDETGNAFVTGRTGSPDFPTTPGAFDTVYSNSSDAFVTKLNPAGSSLVYSTFLGGGGGLGSWSEGGTAIAIDSAGNAFVTGYTDAGNFPTTPDAFDTTFGGLNDVFVAKLDATGSNLLYGTYLGGSEFDEGYGIAVDQAGNAFITGDTGSFSFPTTPGAFDTTYNGSNRDAFVTKLNTTGTTLLYSTFLGGNGNDSGWGIALDGAGNAFITGETQSSNFPTTPGAFDTVHDSNNYDAFVTKVAADGSTLVYSTYLGSDGFEQHDEGYDIVVDETGRALITGGTDSPSFPVTPSAFDTSLNGNFDVFLTRLNTAGSGLIYSTFLGGSFDEVGRSVAMNGMGNAFVTGETGSSNFPTTPGAFDTTHNGNFDAYVLTLALGEFVGANFTAEPTNGASPLLVNFTNLSSMNSNTCLWDFGDGATSNSCQNPTHTYLASGSYTVSLTISGSNGTDSLVRPDFVTVYEANEPPVANFTAGPTSGNAPLLVVFTNLSTGDYDSCLWEFGDGGSSTNCNDPDHTYALPGIYTVTLTVSGPGGGDSDTRPGYITVEFHQSNWLFLPLVSGQD